jgi:hypothetical protein
VVAENQSGSTVFPAFLASYRRLRDSKGRSCFLARGSTLNAAPVADRFGCGLHHLIARRVHVGGFSVLEIGVIGVVPITLWKLGCEVHYLRDLYRAMKRLSSALTHYEPRFGNLNSAERE